MESNKGKNKLVCNGFVYRHERTKKRAHYFVCERKQCGGRGVLRDCEVYNSDAGVFEMSRPHNHAAEERREAVLRATCSMTLEATTSTALPAAIVQSIREKVNRHVAPHLPSEEALRQRIRRRRRVKFPAEPQALGDINVPDELKTTVGGEDFLLFDAETGDEDDDGRIICFATLECLKKLSASQMWFCDGTFKTSPRLFAQLYTIHGMIDGVCFPFVYALLPSKSERVYRILLREVSTFAEENDITLNPRFVMLDFELSAVNAIRHQFPTARVTGCLFHLGQSIYRRVQREGLAGTYKNDAEFQMSVKHLMSLAWLPQDDIPEAFRNIKEAAPEEAQSVFKYFEETYVLGRVIPRRGKKGRPRNEPPRHPPRFPPEFWSVHPLLEQFFPRTNNMQEAWHRRFEAVVGRHHLGVYPTIHELRKEQHRTEHEITRGEAGHKISRPQSAREREREKRLNTLFVKFMNNRATRDEYLRGIAYNYDLGDGGVEVDDADHEDDEDEIDAVLF